MKVFQCPVLKINITLYGCEYSQLNGHTYCKKCEKRNKSLPDKQSPPEAYKKLLIEMIRDAIEDIQKVDIWLDKINGWWMKKRRPKSENEWKKRRLLFIKDINQCLEIRQNKIDAEGWFLSRSNKRGSFLWICRMMGEFEALEGRDVNFDPNVVIERLKLNEKRRKTI